MPRLDLGADHPDIVAHVARHADQFELSVGDLKVAEASDVVGLVPALTKVLDEAVIERLTTLRAVHSGVVLWGGRALLLPGSTHSGKSSLVAELLKRGATYFSDEYALIDREGFVHPYPRPLLMRNGRPWQVPVLPEEYKASVGNSPAPVGWIFALLYKPTRTWNVDPVPQGEAVLTLLRHTPHILAESPDLMGTFQRAVARTDCYAGVRAESGDAVEEILCLIGKPA